MSCERAREKEQHNVCHTVIQKFIDLSYFEWKINQFHTFNNKFQPDANGVPGVNFLSCISCFQSKMKYRIL